MLSFRGFPRGLRWKLVEVTISELSQFRYVRIDPWTTLSGGSLLVQDGASNAAMEPLEEPKNHILAVEREIREGAKFPPIVAVAEGEDQVHVLLEGHSRASAYVRAFQPDDTCKLIAGYASSLSEWIWY